MSNKENDIFRFPDFFVTGNGRSGTTLLAALLSEHRDMFTITDSLIMSRFDNHYRNIVTQRHKSQYKDEDVLTPYPDQMNSKISLTEAKSFISILINTYLEAGFTEGIIKNRLKYGEYIQKIDVENVLNKVRIANTSPNETKMSWKEFLGLLFFQLVPENKKNAICIGEKAPGHIGYYDYIIKDNPNFKYVIIIRDPISNIASNYVRFKEKRILTKKQQIISVVRNRSMDYVFDKMVESHKNFIKGFSNITVDAKTIVVRYEDLLHETQMTLDKIAGFLNLPLYSFEGEFNSMMSEYVGTKIDPKRVNRFNDVFTNQQKKVIKKTFKDFYQQYYSDQN